MPFKKSHKSEDQLSAPSRLVADPGQELLDHVAGLALPQQAKIGIGVIFLFEASDRNRTVFEIALDLLILREALAEDRQGTLNDSTMLAGERLAEHLGDSIRSDSG